MANNDVGVKFFGVIYDEYTPAVEGQMLRDCLIMMNVARHKYRNLIVVCPDPAPERMLNGLGLDRESDPSRTQDWISYRTQEDWPRNIIQRDLYVPKPSGPQMQVNEDGNNGYYLPPQGRLSPDTISLLRPAPKQFLTMGRVMATLHDKISNCWKFLRASMLQREMKICA
jgi:hypothetical protein